MRSVDGQATGDVAVVGSSGFIGTAVSRRLHGGGFSVRRIAAPRLVTEAANPRQLYAEARNHPALRRLLKQLEGADCVVNVAGVSDATSSDTRVLRGANSLLPVLLAEASSAAGIRRMVHVSSAAVQGFGPLDETERTSPFSPYSFSKALGEQGLGLGTVDDLRILRPTSVHGPDRRVTQMVAKFAHSKWSCLPAGEPAVTPQVHVENVAAVVQFLVESQQAPHISLQPWEGFTTRSFLELMGCGQRPKPLPRWAAKTLEDLFGRVPVAKATAWSRRLDMLWRGQSQESSKIEAVLPVLPVSSADWYLMANSLGAGPDSRRGKS